MSDPVRIVRDAPLAGRNTFRVAARAPWLVEVSDSAALPDALQRPELRDGVALVLGGGSNLLFAADPTGGVLALTGRKQVGRGTPPLPEQAIESAKRDVDEVKAARARA